MQLVIQIVLPVENCFLLRDIVLASVCKVQRCEKYYLNALPTEYLQILNSKSLTGELPFPSVSSCAKKACLT